jgi:hypothetical protein
LHDAEYRTKIATGAKGAETASIHEMKSLDKVWNDRLAQGNGHAAAIVLRAIVLRRK